MMMGLPDTYLTDLIARMRDDTPLEAGQSSETLISWKALREAETIADEKYIPELMAYIESESDRENRRKAYFILAKIAANTGDARTAPFLLKRIAPEKREGIASAVMQGLQDLPIPPDADISSLLDITRDDDWLTRQSAIYALKQAPQPEAESRLIEILETDVDYDSRYDRFYACWALQKTGTARALPALKKLLSQSKLDTAACALVAIMNISGRDNLPLYLEYLARGRIKAEALYAVTQYGGESEIPAVIAHAKGLVKKKRARLVILAISADRKARPELVCALEFLLRFRDSHPEIVKLFEELAGKKRDMLFDEEIAWLDGELV